VLKPTILTVYKIASRIQQLNDECGQTMAEYAIVLALIAVVVAAALTTLSGNIGTTLSNVGNSL
jgi:pilus assembly protein Flp/PilA